MKNCNLTQYLVEQRNQKNISELEILLLIEVMSQACKALSSKIGKGAISDILNSTDSKNTQGELQKKLDIISNQIILEKHERGGYLAAVASEELEAIYCIPNCYPRGKYLLLLDPLDGSSNIDINAPIGTIFSVLGIPLGVDNRDIREENFLQLGNKQLASGYVIYGPQTMLIFTIGNGVVGFTLDREVGSWLLTHENMQIPKDTHEFAINMSNQRHWDMPIRKYIKDLLSGSAGPLGKDYNMRWVASMVADVHRILIRGGIFLYPWDNRTPNNPGRLRLMYEANPMSLLIEQAGGAATNGHERILSIEPRKLHERVSVIMGSRYEVERLGHYYSNESI